jgi:hypothetical protein
MKKTKIEILREIKKEKKLILKRLMELNAQKQKLTRYF